MRIFKRCLTLCLAIMVASAPTWSEDDAIESHKRDLTDVEQRLRDLERNLTERREQRRKLGAELERREREIAELARERRRLAATIGEQKQALERLRDRLATEQETLGRERATLGDLLRSLYAVGWGNQVRILLDQEDTKRLSRIMAYYGYFNRVRMKRIEAIIQRARRLDDLARQAAAEKERLVSLAQKQEATHARLATVQDQRASILTALEQTIITREERVEELQAQAQELRLLLEWLEQQALILPESGVSQESLKQLRGRLAWPVADASLLSRYDSPKEGGIQRWDGVVLKVREGAEVRAVHHGQVAYADWLRGFGLLIIIAHDDDYMTLYGHNQALLKERGEWVVTGEPIALSGGGRLSSGLYFAIRYHGRPLNPEQWCRRKAGSKRRSSG